ncbi:ATP-binding protein [Natrinema halophilum]|uniref:histidine kinase n=1 Tax=Natrinema halophilum TaxID=1699371 RepID=A0A7D5KM32_9EURY|nr:ATP-binding protein [Natrinema halophilum]QLG50498.1 ATP-binding protein [Natrinema halophilum]
MARLRRFTPDIGGRFPLLALGGLYIALALGLAFHEVTAGSTAFNEAITFVLIAVPGVVLLVGGHRLPRTDIRPVFYSTITKWSFGGLGAMAGVLAFYSLQPGEAVDDLTAILILTSLASVAGFAAGTYDAQARTRERELEETLEQVRASNERLEQFAYAASHDLQEPLRMVTSYLQLLEERYGEKLDKDAGEFIEYAVEGAERMRTMIDDLLEYSRVETQGDPFESVHLEDVLADVREDLQVRIDEYDAEITAESLPRVQGDVSQLRQVFQNLLVNAMEYSGDEPPRIHVSAKRNGMDWNISVHDEGIGIDPEDQERIFDVFQRLHSREEHPGTGIGLALCKRIVERHGGDIRVDDGPNGGTTFSFTLPAVDAPAFGSDSKTTLPNVSE